MDLITQYSDIILKKIMMKIQKDKKSKERAELVKLEMAETGAGVRSSRHWKAAANIEFYYNEIQKGFDQMRELDRQTNWSKKLHQDRFKFVEKYREILNEYFEEDQMFNLMLASIHFLFYITIFVAILINTIKSGFLTPIGTNLTLASFVTSCIIQLKYIKENE